MPSPPATLEVMTTFCERARGVRLLPAIPVSSYTDRTTAWQGLRNRCVGAGACSDRSERDAVDRPELLGWAFDCADCSTCPDFGCPTALAETGPRSETCRRHGAPQRLLGARRASSEGGPAPATTRGKRNHQTWAELMATSRQTYWPPPDNSRDPAPMGSFTSPATVSEVRD